MHGQSAQDERLPSNEFSGDHPVTELQRPGFGQPQRDAINSVVDNMADGICQRVAIMRKQLDNIEQLVLEGAAKSKHALMDTVDLYAKINDEISRTSDVIADLKSLAENA